VYRLHSPGNNLEDLGPCNVRVQAVSHRTLNTEACIPSRSMLDLLWAAWHCDRFLCRYFAFPVSIILPISHTHSFVVHPCYISLVIDSVVK
jgi:hypothetical protein